ncbi:His/Gly/Thr/Pro-type tRNA ligase C-terminal domain-containing protein, partial [Mesorhizobium sp. M7A.F.Ca.CA.004.04.2.1]
VIVGPRGVAAGEIEIKNRKTGERETLPIADVKKRFGVAA